MRETVGAMSGTSRIGGYGGFSGSGGKQDRSAALTRFCRGRRVGDVVSGVFLRMETEDLGWALLEEEELLAHFPAESVRPAPGDRVFFKIDSLHPEVVLRMLTRESPLARLLILVPAVPVAQEAGNYATARDRLDALLAAALRGRPGLFSNPDPVKRKAAFIDLAASEPAVADAFAETLARSRALGRAAAPAGLVYFRHMPWLSGTLSRVEVSLWEGGESPVFAGARLPTGDSLLLRGEMAGPVLRYRLIVTTPGGGSGGTRIAPASGRFAECRGMDGYGRARPGRAMDLVGRILALAADSGSIAVSRFSRKL